MFQERFGPSKGLETFVWESGFLWVAPGYTFMGLHEGGSGWVAVFGGRVWLVEFWDLWKVLAESCISHWKLEGS